MMRSTLSTRRVGIDEVTNAIASGSAISHDQRLVVGRLCELTIGFDRHRLRVPVQHTDGLFFEVQNPNANQQNPAQTPVSVRCPSCKQQGTLDPLVATDYATQLPGNAAVYIFGQRRCPNPNCHKHIFVVSSGGRTVLSYPPERLDFDSTNIPNAVKSAFEEAIICHSQTCFVAAAIMVRKTLEELCRDKGARGNNLKERIEALGKNIVLPRELLDGADNLRLLGNDAAHIESQEYQQVGKDEVELGIEFAKELLKAAYQYSALLKRFEALKKASPNP